MADARKSILLRISPELWEQLSRLAQRELRSVNAQIEFMLRDGVRKRGRGSDEPERAVPPAAENGGSADELV